MELEKGKELREKSRKMKEKALAAMGPAGSSTKALTKLVELWKDGTGLLHAHLVFPAVLGPYIMVPNSISGRRKEKRRRKGRRRRRKKEKKEGEEEKKEEKKKEKESAGEGKKKEKEKEKEKKREGGKEGRKEKKKKEKGEKKANQEGGGLSDKGNAKQV
ncbi:hypothetical protein ERO13_A07G220150v2 [Gossypium hirsutum]|nr:hypothetical protein ERO13_A07G220150v2 [Gossypium hirsutum]